MAYQDENDGRPASDIEDARRNNSRLDESAGKVHDTTRPIGRQGIAATGEFGKEAGGSILKHDIMERERVHEALAYERAQLLAIFDSIEEIIEVVDPRTYEVLYVNEYAKKSYGNPKTGGVCHKEFYGFDVPCDFCNNDVVLRQKHKRHKREIHNHLLERDFIVTNRIIRWPDGRDAKLALFVDITDRKRLEKQLAQSQKMEAIGTLAGGVAHDFNNLLTIISGYADLLLQGKRRDDAYLADVQKILHASKRGAELVRHLLAFSRKADIQPRLLNINDEVKQVKELLARTIPRTIEIRLHLADNLKTVNADPGQMEQVLMNLAVNARDAMPDGGALTIETAKTFFDESQSDPHIGLAAGEHVMLSVSDTGHGMEKDVLSHIFEPFFTTKEAGRGTGLGLSTVFGIVKQHTGHITCYSEPGVGTVFKIYLPVAEAGTRLTAQMEDAAAVRGGTETILLADDEKDVRDLGKRILAEAGYTVLTAENGRQALEVYKRGWNNISLVILDVVMPKMDGNQCLLGILDINPEAMIVISSGYSLNGSLESFPGLRPGNFVGKPYDKGRLLRTVRDVLDRKY